MYTIGHLLKEIREEIGLPFARSATRIRHRFNTTK